MPQSKSEVEALIARARDGFQLLRRHVPARQTMLSVPVFEQFGGIIAGVTIIGLSRDLDHDSQSDAVRLLKRAGAQISLAAAWHG